MQPKDVLIALLVIILWSLNFVASKIALEHFPVFFLVFLRMLSTSVVLVPFLRSFKKLRISWVLLMGISFTWATLHISALFLALHMGLDVSAAIMIDQLRVPFVVILGLFIFKDTIGFKTFSGILLSLIGTAFIAGTPSLHGNYIPFILMVASSFAWALYNIQLKFTHNLKVLYFLAWVTLFGLIQATPLTFLVEEHHWDILLSAKPIHYTAVFYSGVINTVIGNGLWYKLLKKYSVNQVVPYSLLVPFFGTLAAVIVLGEVLTWQIVAGGVLTVAGVTIIMMRRPRLLVSGKEE
ncbi:MAG: EamA family transporter [Alphaproteobacteria bacterium]|nr:EamA family transporter [Alphaproteobacteria bacterium]